jgi:catechol 2,3-dioxygenase-like lactoylglutathione lyase family enzyme
MTQGVGVAGIYVHDQDEALAFYVDKLGFAVHTDARNGDYRWLTVQHPDQPSFQLGLFKPQPPTVDDAAAQSLNELVAKGAMPPLVLVVDDCRAAHDGLQAKGVEFTQEPVERDYGVDCGLRDPFGNAIRILQVEPATAPAAT